MIRFATVLAAALMLAPAVAPQPPAPEAPPRNPFDPSEIEVAFAPGGAGMPDVDVELILMADVSRSMSPEEMRLQREGYVAALRSPEVAAAVAQGAHGRIALAYAEFAGDTGQVKAVDWTVVADAAGLAAFAERLAAAPTRLMMEGCVACGYGTSVGGAIAYAHGEIAGNGLTAERRVIDVSGDGDDNSAAVKAGPARDLAVADGITVNGLPVITDSNTTDLEGWYRDHVIGGAGAFLVAVDGFGQFGEAVRRKLVLEIAGRPVEQRFAGVRQ